MLPHVLFEWSAYAVGFGLYWRGRDRVTLPPEAWRRLAVVAAAVAGAAVGSKLLYLGDYWTALAGAPWPEWLSGKTIVGALLGGMVAVEVIKKSIDWNRSTGDAFVAPLIIGMIIGRIGCQLSDARDLTYGIPTSLPWGWNYGDGVPRHPTALYEIVALTIIGLGLARSKGLRRVPGRRFRAFVVAYLALRFVLEFLKPPHGMPMSGVPVPDAFAGLSAIQWACLAGLVFYAFHAARRIQLDRAAGGGAFTDEQSKVAPEL
jgi:phosphatidylglycerol:prolipoprotein diacylglycerol transferase